METERNAQKKMKERDGGDRLETARREDEDVEVRGQEEGGEGSSDPGQSGLLKSACVFYALYTLCVVCSCMCVRVCVSSPMYNKSWSARQCRSLSPTLPLPLPFERRQSHSSVCVWKCVCSSLIVLIVVRRRLNAVNSRHCHFGGKFLKHWDCLLLHVATSLARNVTWAACQSTTLIDSLHKQKQTTRSFFCFFVFNFPNGLKTRMADSRARPTLSWWVWRLSRESRTCTTTTHQERPAYLCGPHVHCVLLA